MKTARLLLCGLGLLASCAMPTDTGSYDVTLSDSGALALVRPLTETATVAGVERAARDAAPRGCRALAAPILYDLVGGDRDAVLPASATLRFAGRLPATLSCG